MAVAVRFGIMSLSLGRSSWRSFKNSVYCLCLDLDGMTWTRRLRWNHIQHITVVAFAVATIRAIVAVVVGICIERVGSDLLKLIWFAQKSASRDLALYISLEPNLHLPWRQNLQVSIRALEFLGSPRIMQQHNEIDLLFLCKAVDYAERILGNNHILMRHVFGRYICETCNARWEKLYWASSLVVSR